jgi:hypothetical protein
MSVVTLPLALGSQARTILHHLLEHGDVAGCDLAGRTLITRGRRPAARPAADA